MDFKRIKYSHYVNKCTELPSSRAQTIIITLSILLCLCGNLSYHFQNSFGEVIVPNLAVQTVASGLKDPTSMAFLGPDDILVLEQVKGEVRRIVNGTILPEPVLDVNVPNEREKYGIHDERGLMGIAVSKNVNADKTYVFLFYTEAEMEDGGEPIGNRVYRYEFVDNTLINPKLLLDLPYLPGPAHIGGVITIGPDNNLYVMVGNLYSPELDKDPPEPNLVQNYQDGKDPDGRGGILRVTQDGQLVGTGILGKEHPLNFYYAYGIRNSFGMGFDPLTGKLWDTENGGRNEINLVEPGFNSGYDQVTGMHYFYGDDFDTDNLVDFNGKGKYSDPELDIPIPPTSIVFFHSDKYGQQFENNMFVGTVSGEIFHFNLDNGRTELDLQGDLADKVADPSEELESVKFADEMGIITDLEVGPDGYLYVTIYDDNDGKIIKIIPSSTNNADSDDIDVGRQD
jgi:glucose/arabinose dehydrogenase